MKNNQNKKLLGIYVHIPFCVQKCKYCDFCSFASIGEDIKEAYISALKKDIIKSSPFFDNYTVDSIFFGGGTPTCIPANTLGDILKTLKRRYNVSNEAEITIECNPATADENDFSILLNSGFNRLSMGVQSSHDTELFALGRIHTFDNAKQTYAYARSAGFKNINLDLMYGIPLQTEKSFSQTLDRVISLKPEHISAYALKIEPGTEFYKKRFSLELPDEDAEYNMYRLADRLLSQSGFEHYEISNYALNEKKSKHNLKYWSCDEYVGFGTSAHSLVKNVRYSNTNSIKKYIASICTGINDHFSIEEKLSITNLVEEYIMMRLRLSDGLSESFFAQKFNFHIDNKYIERMHPFIKSGHIKNENGIYRFTSDGMYVSNYILSEILDLE